MLAYTSHLYQRFPIVLLLLSLLHISACGEEEEPPVPTELYITANVRSIEEGEEFAITVRTDVPNRTGTDFSIALIYEGIDQAFIEGNSTAPIILQDWEFSSQTLTINDDPDSTGDRELTVRIDESQVPAGLTLVRSSVSITIEDK